jgi:hypothetical protein
MPPPKSETENYAQEQFERPVSNVSNGQPAQMQEYQHPSSQQQQQEYANQKQIELEQQNQYYEAQPPHKDYQLQQKEIAAQQYDYQPQPQEAQQFKEPTQALKEETIQTRDEPPLDQPQKEYEPNVQHKYQMPEQNQMKYATLQPYEKERKMQDVHDYNKMHREDVLALISS